MKSGTEKLQEIELGILEVVLGIFEKYHLNYYMLGGTLLGAVRHHGFIPWDDDIDLGLPRPDYEIFLKCAEKELGYPFRLRTIDTLKAGECEYAYYYARVENLEVKLKRNISVKSVIIPAFIDIFPLDGVPDDEKLRKKWLRRCDFCRKLYSASQIQYMGKGDHVEVHRPFLKKILRKLVIKLRLDRLISTSWAWSLYDHALKQYKYEDCKTLINFGGAWGIKEMFSKDVYGKGKSYQFEQFILNGPEDYDKVLTQMYGDYMTPPKDANKEHHYLEIVS